MNSVMIKQDVLKEERFIQLNEIAKYQLGVLDEKEKQKSIKKY